MGKPSFMDVFEEHNLNVERLWKDFNSGKPERIPVQWSINYKVILLNYELNTLGYGFTDVFNNPEAMLRVTLEFEHWRRHNIWCDGEMGLPKQWNIAVGFQNIYESAWLGGEIFYSPEQVPDVKPFLRSKEDMEAFVKRGVPDPFSGFMAKVKGFYEYFLKKKDEGFTFRGVPLGNVGTPIGTDGPFTIAINITGGEVLKILYSDQEFAERFLWHIAECLIERMKAWHRFMKVSFPYEGFGFADDAIQLLSPKSYARFVLPLHKEIVRSFCVGRPGIHLCGAVEHHLETLRDELHIRSLDSGFPLNLSRARDILGEDVIIKGNLHILTLLQGSKREIEEETVRIIKSGVARGRRYIFGEGNNVAPNTPPENLNYAYEIVKRNGRYIE